MVLASFFRIKSATELFVAVYNFKGIRSDFRKQHFHQVLCYSIIYICVTYSQLINNTKLHMSNFASFQRTIYDTFTEG